MTDAQPSGRGAAQPAWTDRFRGAMLGGAVGDAVGSGVRALPLAGIRSCFGPPGIRGYVPVFGKRGAAGDISQLTVFTLDALLRAKAANPGGDAWLPTEYVGTNYLRWLHTQGVPWEYAMSAQLSREPRPAGWLLERAELHSTRNPGGPALGMVGKMAERFPIGPDGALRPHSAADGLAACAAWAAPAMVWSPTPEIVHATAAATANLFTSGPNALGAAGLHSDVLAQLLRGARLWDAVTAADLNRLGSAYRVSRVPADVRRTVHAAMFLGQRGLPVRPEDLDVEFDVHDEPGELGIALAAVSSTRTFADAVLAAVNHSADSSVTGALAGQLAGAMHGPGSIPQEWLDELELREPIEILCQDAGEAFAPQRPRWAERYMPSGADAQRELPSAPGRTVEGSAERTMVLPAIGGASVRDGELGQHRSESVPVDEPFPTGPIPIVAAEQAPDAVAETAAETTAIFPAVSDQEPEPAPAAEPAPASEPAPAPDSSSLASDSDPAPEPAPARDPEADAGAHRSPSARERPRHQPATSWLGTEDNPAPSWLSAPGRPAFAAFIEQTAQRSAEDGPVDSPADSAPGAVNRDGASEAVGDVSRADDAADSPDLRRVEEFAPPAAQPDDRWPDAAPDPAAAKPGETADPTWLPDSEGADPTEPDSADRFGSEPDEELPELVDLPDVPVPSGWEPLDTVATAEADLPESASAARPEQYAPDGEPAAEPQREPVDLQPPPRSPIDLAPESGTVDDAAAPADVSAETGAEYEQGAGEQADPVGDVPDAPEVSGDPDDPAGAEAPGGVEFPSGAGFPDAADDVDRPLGAEDPGGAEVPVGAEFPRAAELAGPPEFAGDTEFPGAAEPSGDTEAPDDAGAGAATTRSADPEAADGSAEAAAQDSAQVAVRPPRGEHAKDDGPGAGAPSSTERVLGCLLAGALGDALGAEPEGRAADGTGGDEDGLRDPGAGYMLSADARLALFTAEGLIRGSVAGRTLGSGDPLPEVQLAYQRWLHTQGVEWSAAAGRFGVEYAAPDGWLIEVPGMFAARAPERAVFDALSGFGSGGPAGSLTERINDAAGGGGVVRAVPAALWSADPAEVFLLGARTAALTHSDPAGYHPAGALAVIVQQALLGRGLDDGVWLALQVLETWEGSEQTAALLKAAVELAEEGVPDAQRLTEVLGGGGTGQQALAIAVCAALAADADVQLALRTAAQHDGSGAAAGAICGSIAGALHGVAALPVDWLAELELRDVVQQVALDCVAEFGVARSGEARSGGAELPADEDWQERYPVRELPPEPVRRQASDVGAVDDPGGFPAPKPAPRRVVYEGDNA
ncbi:ADP-ribosylglycohydrolase family protein [Saccharopolyspora sp. HNM0983]|uniref:ADP-ribosylglycohydrolase family protein n=1 Tax=Saccharopolyspora montiporae TaxID=2781240 RepID=A0A929B825_9PSEU|nr:ADP-ribosylglycohydrolase family protein [Saccharopolyspora sp. HNM0983]MBE9374969.1 ADP-ribosylglycohydrolase family protein [Saccharopolyspora sp. HNM0983]